MANLSSGLLLLLGACAVLPSAALPAFLNSTSGSFHCIDDSGSSADYWMALKENSGWGYYYYGAGSTTMKRSSHDLSQKSGAIVDTIQQLYTSLGDSYAYAVYNDETDESKKSSTRAHAKGVVLFGKTKGFWLIHSVPRYPNRISKGYEAMPDNTYGQSFICLTLSTKDSLNDVGKQLMIAHPQLYDSGISDDLASAAPDFADFVNDKKSDDDSNTVTFSTYSGTDFTHVVKSGSWGKELYEDLVAPTLDADLQVETWMNGELSNKIPSSCKGSKFKYNVRDVRNVTLSDDTTWDETQDHSKWAVTDSSTKATVCIGDINRQYSQSSRGGGTMCFKNKAFWSAFSKIPTGVDSC